MPTVNLNNTECKRHATDVEGKISGCSVSEAVLTSCGKYKLIHILYADIGDYATSTNVLKTESIGKKSIDKTHHCYSTYLGGSKIRIVSETCINHFERTSESVTKGTSLKNLSGC